MYLHRDDCARVLQQTYRRVVYPRFERFAIIYNYYAKNDKAVLLYVPIPCAYLYIITIAAVQWYTMAFYKLYVNIIVALVRVHKLFTHDTG